MRDLVGLHFGSGCCMCKPWLCVALCGQAAVVCCSVCVCCAAGSVSLCAFAGLALSIADVHAIMRYCGSAFLCCSSLLCRRKQKIGVFRCGGRSLTRSFLVGEKGQCTVRVCAVDLRKSLQEDEHQCRLGPLRHPPGSVACCRCVKCR